MELFRRLLNKSKLLLVVLMVGIGFLILNLVHQLTQEPKAFAQDSVPIADSSKPVLSTVSQLKPTLNKNNKELIEKDEDSIVLKEMTEQMEKDREQQKQIKLLRLSLEQTTLRLEQEKALSEINKLKKENVGFSNGLPNSDQGGIPSVAVVYLGGSTEEKEALISINGTNYPVKVKSKPTKDIEVTDISDRSVTLHFIAPIDTTATYDYKTE